MIAVDTNVLVYAHRREPQEHSVAASQLSKLATGVDVWAIPWPCVCEFFSVVTNRRIWKDAASTPEQAWLQVDAWLGSPSVRMLSETEDFAKVLGELGRWPRVSGPVGDEARAAALCPAHREEVLLPRRL